MRTVVNHLDQWMISHFRLEEVSPGFLHLFFSRLYEDFKLWLGGRIQANDHFTKYLKFYQIFFNIFHICGQLECGKILLTT